jgi:ribosomal protein L16 Arg81 hydroxylase
LSQFDICLGLTTHYSLLNLQTSSRIISHVPRDHSSFELSWGPLTGKDKRAWISKQQLSSNNEKKRRETLVVNDIDRFYPPLADWIFDIFRFIPNWRMDDGQISLSEEGGGIGPHVDNYDVFLIQVSGTRTWQIGRRKISPHEERDRMIDGLDVRVLSGWPLNGDGSGDLEMEEWIVHPGDLLYLPPRVAHCGISLSDDCMTLSVGCRAPSVSDLVSKLAETLSSSIEDYSVRRYTDSELLVESYSGIMPGELTLDAKVRAKQLVMDSLTSMMNDDEWWDEFLGRHVTEQKRVRNNYPIPLDSMLDDGEEVDEVSDEWADARSTVQSVLAGKGVLYQAEGIAFAYSTVRSDRHDGREFHRFFVNGEMWQRDFESDEVKQSSIVRIFKIVANHRMLDRSLLLGLDSCDDPDTQCDELSSEAIAFLEELVSIGVLYGSNA